MKKKYVELFHYSISEKLNCFTFNGKNNLKSYKKEHSSLHIHNCDEIIIIYEGQIKLLTSKPEDELILHKGEMVFIPHGFMHKCVTVEEKLARISIILLDTEKMIKKIFSFNPQMMRFFINDCDRPQTAFSIQNNDILQELADIIIDTSEQQSLLKTLKLQGLMQTFVCEIIPYLYNHENSFNATSCILSESLQPVPSDSLILQQILNYVEKEYKTIKKISQISQKYHISDSSLRRLFEQNLHMTPLEYLNMIRVTKGSELLRQSNLSTLIISEQVGFTSLSSFNRNFKKFFHTSPIHWKHLNTLSL